MLPLIVDVIFVFLDAKSILDDLSIQIPTWRTEMDFRNNKYGEEVNISYVPPSIFIPPSTSSTPPYIKIHSVYDSYPAIEWSQMEGRKEVL